MLSCLAIPFWSTNCFPLRFFAAHPQRFLIVCFYSPGQRASKTHEQERKFRRQKRHRLRTAAIEIRFSAFRFRSIFIPSASKAESPLLVFVPFVSRIFWRRPCSSSARPSGKLDRFHLRSWA